MEIASLIIAIANLILMAVSVIIQIDWPEGRGKHRK